MCGEQMPFEQQDYIDRLKQYCLDVTNMKEDEAYHFAFRCWQLNMDNHVVRNPRHEFLGFLGRGSCYNVVKEGSTSAFFKSGDSLLLIDCGETTFHDLLKHENILDGVKQIDILITHMHSDHVGSLPSLIYYATYVLGAKIFIMSNDNKRLTKILKLSLYLDMDEYEKVAENITVLNSSFTISDMKVSNICKHASFRLAYAYSGTIVKLPGFDGCSIHVIPIKEYHVDRSVGYVISKKERGQTTTVYYSGDTKQANMSDVNKCPFDIDFYYLDAADRGPDYPHQSIQYIKDYLNIDLNKVRLIHIDSDSVLERAKEIGLKPVTVLGRELEF